MFGLDVDTFRLKEVHNETFPSSPHTKRIARLYNPPRTSHILLSPTKCTWNFLSSLHYIFTFITFFFLTFYILSPQPPGHPLAAPPLPRLLPLGQLLPLHPGRHALGWAGVHWLFVGCLPCLHRTGDYRSGLTRWDFLTCFNKLGLYFRISDLKL